MTDADLALTKLKDGNLRFVADRQDGVIDATRRVEIADGQQPFAVILGCSDSRVPAELVFDQGLGDLFVIRVAGNIAAPSQIGSLEYAVAELGCRLIVVLGHTSCGAVQAAIDNFDQIEALPSPNLQAIVSRIVPAIRPVMDAGFGDDRAALVEAAVRANIDATQKQIEQDSELLRGFLADDGLVIVGAEYDLKTGSVLFFDIKA